MKKIKSLIALILVGLIAVPHIVFAEPPAKPPGDSNGGSSSNVSYTGATTFSSATNENNKTYTTDAGS